MFKSTILARDETFTKVVPYSILTTLINWEVIHNTKSSFGNSEDREGSSEVSWDDKSRSRTMEYWSSGTCPVTTFIGTLEKSFVPSGAIVEFALIAMFTVRNVAGVLALGICVALMPGTLPSTALHQPVELFEQFENTAVFWEQFEVAKKIVALGDESVLPRLEPWLHCGDMRRRGNAGFIFAKFGDDRGFQTIVSILDDSSTNRAIEARDDAGEPSPKMQIRADRYYAAHLLGDLRDVRAVPILIPLLKDEDVKYIVPWSLAEIGDKSAIPSLKNALGDDSLTMRAAAQLALEKLEGHSPD
jgi:hypothetical protein